jgi:hypothetical protein
MAIFPHGHHGQGINGGMCIPPGITTSWTRNPRGIHKRNGYSTGNYQLINSVLQDKSEQKIFQRETIVGLSTPNPLYQPNAKFFFIFTYKNVFKMKNLSHEIKRASKSRATISLKYMDIPKSELLSEIKNPWHVAIVD